MSLTKRNAIYSGNFACEIPFVIYPVIIGELDSITSHYVFLDFLSDSGRWQHCVLSFSDFYEGSPPKAKRDLVKVIGSFIESRTRLEFEEYLDDFEFKQSRVLFSMRKE